MSQVIETQQTELGVNSAYIINFDAKGDGRGQLISLESEKNIPFKIFRTYYIFDTKPGVRRGFHAHRRLEQVAVCVKGSCSFLLDDGEKREDVHLSSPEKGLYIGHMVWREMYGFSEDCVLMVLASDYYDESDYIKNHDDFLELCFKSQALR